MVQPQGFVDSRYPTHVCKLQKALYGLKQALCAWYLKLSSALLSWDFVQCQSDSCMFLYMKSSVVIILLVYVDDILLTGSHPTILQQLIAKLNGQFALKDLGSLHFFLGIKAHRTDSSLHLSQAKYISDLLLKPDMADCKYASTPMAADHALSINDGTPLDNPTAYRSFIGALQYCTLTRPDISFVVNKLCQFMHHPTDAHWLAMKRLFRYLKGTLHYGITLHYSLDISLSAYTDVDWASCPND